MEQSLGDQLDKMEGECPFWGREAEQYKSKVFAHPATDPCVHGASVRLCTRVFVCELCLGSVSTVQFFSLYEEGCSSGL